MADKKNELDQKQAAPAAAHADPESDDEKDDPLYRSLSDPSDNVLLGVHGPVMRSITTADARSGNTDNSASVKGVRGLGTKTDAETDVAARDVDARPPPPAGDYIEPHYSVKALPDVTAAKITQELQTTLQSLQLDYTHEPNDFRFRCFQYVHAQEIPFIVSLFSTPSDDDQAITIEFQRRCGDVMAFCDMYKQALQKLEQGKIIDSSSVPQTRQRRMPVLKPRERTEEDIKLSREAIRGVAGMLTSQYLDVKTEGGYALAHLSSEVDKRILIFEEAHEAIKAALLHSNVNVHRAALTLLANLCEPDVAPQVPAAVCPWLRATKDAQGHNLLERIYELSHKAPAGSAQPSAQVVRECARLLQNYAAFVKADGHNDNGLLQTLSRLADPARVTDQRTRDYATAGRVLLGTRQ